LKKYGLHSPFFVVTITVGIIQIILLMALILLSVLKPAKDYFFKNTFAVTILAIVCRSLSCFVYIFYGQDVYNLTDYNFIKDGTTRISVSLFDIPYYLFFIVLCATFFSWVQLYFNLRVVLTNYEDPPPPIGAAETE
jgi:hypothetical protein